MGMLPKTNFRRHEKGQADHVDAWLMSYADLITLLFMFFVIIVSVSVAQHQRIPGNGQGEPAHPYLKQYFSTLALGTTHDAAYGALTGIVASNHADQNIGIEKSQRGLSVDVSSLRFFAPGSADIPDSQLPILRQMAQALKQNLVPGDRIEVEGYTDDEPVKNSPYANNWELAAMRATRIVQILIDAGIDPAQLHAVSYAADHPAVPNTDAYGIPIPENRARNQRVVIRVETPEAPQTPIPRL